MSADNSVRSWRKIRSWIVTLGACGFVLGMIYLMLSGQFLPR